MIPPRLPASARHSPRIHLINTIQPLALLNHHALLRLSPPRPENTSETLTLAILLVKPLLLLLPLLVLDVGDETVDSLP